MGDFIIFITFLSLLHYGLMWMVHEIFHAMFEIKERRFCWCIHVATEAHCGIFKAIARLDSDVNDYINPVI